MSTVFSDPMVKNTQTIGTIKIDFSNIIDRIRPVHNIGIMPDYELNSKANSWFTKANMTSCRTHDIRPTDLHRIFPDFSKDVNDEQSYFFDECDKIIAAILDTGMEPFFRLGISYSDPVKDRAYLLPPDDFLKWAQICEHIILHYNYGWANGFNYNIQYWEIYNEPDNEDVVSDNVFWQGTPEEFYELYDVTAKYLKSKFKDLKIGGYGSCGFYALTDTNAANTGSGSRNRYFITFFEGFLAYISEHNTPMDFFSWHSYTTTFNNSLYLNYVKESLVKCGYGDAEIICNEWNYHPTENDKIDRRYGANQTSMLLMFQNKGIDMAHYYCGKCDPTMIHAGMFVKNIKPSSAYYGFMAFGHMYSLGNQAEIINNNLPDDLYAVAAAGKNGQALLISNISEDKNYALKLDAGEYKVDKCMTVNQKCELVLIELPRMIESGEILFITFKE